MYSYRSSSHIDGQDCLFKIEALSYLLMNKSKILSVAAGLVLPATISQGNLGMIKPTAP